MIENIAEGRTKAAVECYRNMESSVAYMKRIGRTPEVYRVGAAITRTAARFAALQAGIPAILVPSPYVPNNHQHYNALSMVKRGCAMELEEKDLSAKKLEDLLDEAMNDPEKLSAMRKAAEGAGYPNAAGDILDLMKQMSRKDK